MTPFEALADAGNLLGRLLEALASAIAGRAPTVPAHAEALLARLFPAATCISATLPSAGERVRQQGQPRVARSECQCAVTLGTCSCARLCQLLWQLLPSSMPVAAGAVRPPPMSAPTVADGQGIAVTTLLHPGAAGAAAAATDAAAATAGSVAVQAQQAQQARHEHVEPLGHGTCSFQLACPPGAPALRLMRALLQQLDHRLCLEAAEGAAAAALAERLGGGAVASPKAGCRLQVAQEQPQGASLRAPAAMPASLLAAQEAGAMPADCFWASF